MSKGRNCGLVIGQEGWETQSPGCLSTGTSGRREGGEPHGAPDSWEEGKSRGDEMDRVGVTEDAVAEQHFQCSGAAWL